MSTCVYIYKYMSMYIVSLYHPLTGKPSRRDSNKVITCNNQPGSDFNQHNITVDATTMIRNSGG